MAEPTFANLANLISEANAIAALVTEGDFMNSAATLISEFEYQGLDVRALANVIYSRGSLAGRNNGQIREDIWTMILLFLCRGNNISKMSQRSKEGGKIKIRDLRTNYSLVDKVGNGGSDVLTLSRVAAVFPVVTLKLLSKPELDIPRSVTLARGTFGEEFPRVMQTVIAASAFPKGDIGKSLMKALLLYLIEENKLLSKASARSDMAILDDVIRFARASYTSSLVSQEDRTQMIGRLGFTTNGVVSGTITPATASFERLYPGYDLSFMN